MVDPPRVEFIFSLLHFSDTGWANVLALEMDNFIRLSAEDTSWLIFFQNDAVAINVNFQGVLFTNAEGSSQLNGNHDSS